MALTAENTASTIRKEITDLQSALSQTAEKKESLFKEKEEAAKKFSEIVSKLKKLKREIDTARDHQLELKKKRDELNKAVHPLIQRAKQLNEEKKKFSSTPGARNPERIMEAIQKLESKIETEALKLTEEKKLMQKIHLLRKQLGEAEQVRLVLKESRDLSRNIEQLKQEADTYHQKFKNALTQHRNEVQEFMDLSKQASQMREKTEALKKVIVTSKQELASLNKNIGQKLMQTRNLMHQRKKIYEQHGNQQRTALIETKIKEVEEKIRQGKKLTRDDFLVYQMSHKES